MNLDVHYSSATGEHPTPRAFYEALDKVYRFTLDAAARGEDESIADWKARRIAHAKALIKKGKSKDDAIKSAKKLHRWKKNNLHERFFSLARSAFLYRWGRPSAPGRVYCNPPYGRGLRLWLARGLDQLKKGNVEVIVWLLPARTDTAWFHDHFWDREANKPRPGVEIDFKCGRLKFGDAKNSAPFPSMVVIDRRRYGI